MSFSDQLLKWYKQHARSLPWRNTKDPYAIWISEVILQQTRINQGISYYYRFLDAFPDVQSLAEAGEAEVLRCWQGLGYYSRARNLHAAAKQVVKEHGGVLPRTSAELMRLKGIGPYTAAAIASIAFNETVPAIDGNVMRVLARYFAIEEVIETSKGKKVFYETAKQLIPTCCAGDFNQAMMDFGSLVCKPVSPDCNECMFNGHCLAYLTNSIDQLPRKRKKKLPIQRFFHYFVIQNGTDGTREPCVYVKQRHESGIWQNMYEFPMLEAERELSAAEILSHHNFGSILPGIFLRDMAAHPIKIKHQLSHQTIFASFYSTRIDSRMVSELDSLYQCKTLSEFESLAKPRLIDRFLREHLCCLAPGFRSGKQTRT